MADRDDPASPAGETVAAFPLGTVLLPGQVLELVVFEPRYRVMLFDLRAAEPAEFLVSMIERGSEVGGGDVRSPVGCIATIARRSDRPDGTTALSIIGTDRALVRSWLPEDPYPVAEVQRLADSVDADPERSARSARDLLRVGESVMDLAEALGQPRDTRPPRWSGDPGQLVWQLALATPLATLDRYRLLAEHDLTRRMAMIAEMMRDVGTLLEARLAGPPPGTGP